MCRGAFAALLVCAMPTEARESRHFDFDPGGNAADHPAYDAARGFGFETADPDGADRFSVRVSEGNHRITLEIDPRRSVAGTSLYAEQRRAMASVPARPGELSFVVNVRTPELAPLPANATGGMRVALKPREIGALNWDEKLTLEFPARVVRSMTVEPFDGPTLYLAGDSTVTDQPVAPNASWGQMLPQFLDGSIAVANHAESGETLKSFVTELRLDKLLSTLRAGDWVMIQFGHNDQKAQWPQTYADAATTYRSWLRTYIAEVRRHGATPILVTSPDRRNFDASGKITSTLGDYPAAMRAVAAEDEVALVDLNAMSRTFYEALGPDVSARAFADDGRDRTHFNVYGARSLARCVVEGLRDADPKLTAGLEKHLSPGLGRFDPARPDPAPTPDGQRVTP